MNGNKEWMGKKRFTCKESIFKLANSVVLSIVGQKRWGNAIPPLFSTGRTLLPLCLITSVSYSSNYDGVVTFKHYRWFASIYYIFCFLDDSWSVFVLSYFTAASGPEETPIAFNLSDVTISLHFCTCNSFKTERKCAKIRARFCLTPFMHVPHFLFRTTPLYIFNKINMYLQFTKRKKSLGRRLWRVEWQLHRDDGQQKRILGDSLILLHTDWKGAGQGQSLERHSMRMGEFWWLASGFNREGSSW